MKENKNFNNDHTNKKKMNNTNNNTNNKQLLQDTMQPYQQALKKYLVGLRTKKLNWIKYRFMN